MKAWIIILVVAIVVIAGAAAYTLVNGQSSPAVIEYKTYGGFVNPQYGVADIVIDQNTVTFRTLSSSGEVMSQQTSATDRQKYDALVKSINDNSFFSLQDQYRKQGVSPDVGTTEITVKEQGRSKTVRIGFFENATAMPGNLQSILDSAAPIVDMVQAPE